MNPLTRFVLFVAALVGVVCVAANPDLFSASLVSRYAKVSRGPAGDISALGESPSQVLVPLRSTGAIESDAANHLTATGEEGRITLWQLPDEKPVLEIDAGEGFQVLQVRFVPGKSAVAGCGPTADGKGSLRIFDVATGKQTSRIDDPEPIVFMDFDRSGAYLVYTGSSTITVWDLAANKAVSVVPRNSADAVGVFFLDDRYVLQSAPVSLYDWKGRRPAVGLNDIGAVEVKKISSGLYAWLTSDGLHTLRSPHGRREFIPFDARGIQAFDLAPDGKWGLFLNGNTTMALIDCTTGLTVQTLALKVRPDAVSIGRDGANAFVVYGAGRIEVFDVGNENVARHARFYAARFFTRLWSGMGDATRRLPWAGNPAS